VYDFAFVLLYLDSIDDQAAFFVQKRLFELDVFTPDEALVLTARFYHYLIPRGGIMFTDADGVRHHMFITDGSPRGGCWPTWGLSPHRYWDWAVWVE
jgi:hypothetical protein